MRRGWAGPRSILFRYVLKEFFKYVGGTILLAMFLFVLFDFIHRSTGYFPKHNPSGGAIFRFYVFQMPSLLTQAIPIAALLGSVICMLLLARSNEITAMRAVGMGPWAIGYPIAVGGLLLSLAAVFIDEIVVPRSTERMHYIQQVVIEKDDDYELSENTKWIRVDDRIFHFEDYNPISEVMTNFTMIELSQTFRPRLMTTAKSAKFDPNLNAWEITNIQRTVFYPNGTIQDVAYIESDMMDVPVLRRNLRRERRQPREMALPELARMIRSGRTSGADVTGFIVDYHVKLAFHFAALVVSLVGVQFTFQSERRVESTASIFLAIAIGMSYWFILSSARTLASKGVLHPMVGAWLANVTVLGITGIQIHSAQKRHA
jgi:lipopolysaccharide export system permease protein